jgi:hypothetical protein
LELDLATDGIVRLQVEEAFSFGDRAKQEWKNAGVNPLAFQVVQKNGTLHIGTDITIAGRFLAPNGGIRIPSRVNLSGWVQGKTISIEPDTKICEPPTLLAFTHSQIAYAPHFDALQPAYQAVVPMGNVQVFAKAKDGASQVSIQENGNQKTMVVQNAQKGQILPWCAETRYRLEVKQSANPVLRVKADVSCDGASCDGSSWSKAFKNLETALAVAKEQGKSIWLAEGTYAESVVLPVGTAVYGGFEGKDTETLETRNGNINKVLLQGTAEKPVVAFVKGSGLPFAQLLDRITLMGGERGILSVGASPDLDYLVVKGNTTAENGAGIMAFLSDTVSVSNSYIVGNTANWGGGVFSENGTISLVNTIVAQNTAQDGAGIYAESGNLVLRHATVASNTAGGN